MKKEIGTLVMELLQWIRSVDPRVADLLVKAYNANSAKGISPAELEEIAMFFMRNSIVAAAVLASPGGSVISELLYDQVGGTEVDRYFFKSGGGSAVKGRLEAMEKRLPVFMKEYLEKNGSVAVGSLGSGPGRYIISAVKNLLDHGASKGTVKGYCYDSDAHAMWSGKRKAVISGVGDAVSFRRVDMMGKSLPTHKKSTLDILVLKGILCPYEAPGCKMVLDHVKPMLKPGGMIIASNVSTAMVEGDPFTCFIMNEIVDWVMAYKTEEELRQIFEASGLIWEGSFSDDLGYHIMGVGRIS